MWLLLAFTSAFMLGLYDISKKKSLTGNAVLPVLFINILLSSAVFAAFIISSHCGLTNKDSLVFVPAIEPHDHMLIAIKSLIVLSSWICGYFAIKHLPLTITGQINAMRPVFVLIGAMIIFQERLNGWQWAGTILALLSFFLLSLSGKKEGINFGHNVWITLLILAALLGAASGLYDKFLMRQIDPMSVQAWFNIYQLPFVGTIQLLMWLSQKKGSSSHFKWRNSILLIHLFLAIADFMYFYALSLDGAMISVVSMIRRSSVVVSFLGGALLFHESNLKRKAFDLLLVIAGMICLYIGSD